MKKSARGKNSNRNNSLMNNVSLEVQDVPMVVDVLSVVLIVGLLVLVNSNLTVPEESKLAFLLALIVLISCYSVEIAIVVVIIALLAGTLFFSGVVTFEEDDEESDEAEGADTKGEHLVKSDDHPGWLWDAEKEEWVPDPDHIDEWSNKAHRTVNFLSNRNRTYHNGVHGYYTSWRSGTHFTTFKGLCGLLR